MKRLLRNESGFTLAEVLVVSTLLFVILAAAWMAFAAVNANVDSLSVQTTLSNDTDHVAEVATRELRQAQEVQTGEGVFTAASGNDVTFYSQVNSGNVPQRVRYYRQGNTLYKTVEEPSIAVYPYNFGNGQTRAVIDSLAETTTPIFSFYTNSVPPAWIETPDASNLNKLSLVGVSITAAHAKAASQTITHTARSKVKIRCMFDSLN